MVFNFVSDERFRSLLRQPSWENLEKAGPLITVGGNGAGSLEYLKIGVIKARNKAVLKEPYLGEPMYHRALSSMFDEELDDVLRKFVAKKGCNF